MNKPRAAPVLLRGLIVQLFAITILPLTLLLLAIAFGSERDKRAVQSATAALESELQLILPH